jgi:hypothetical protein
VIRIGHVFWASSTCLRPLWRTSYVSNPEEAVEIGDGAPVKQAEKKVKDERKCCMLHHHVTTLFLLPFLLEFLKNMKNSKY